MKHLITIYDEIDDYSTIDRLESKGIPIHVVNVTAGMGAPKQTAIFVLIEQQYQDAVNLLNDENHIVKEPVDIVEFYKSVKPTPLAEVLSGMIKLLAIVAIVFTAVLVYAIYKWKTHS